MARGRRHGTRASGTEDEQEVGAGTDDDAVETLLECGERLKRYARQDVEAKAEANNRDKEGLSVLNATTITYLLNTITLSAPIKSRRRCM